MRYMTPPSCKPPHLFSSQALHARHACLVSSVASKCARGEGRRRGIEIHHASHLSVTAVDFAGSESCRRKIPEMQSASFLQTPTLHHAGPFVHTIAFQHSRLTAPALPLSSVQEMSVALEEDARCMPPPFCTSQYLIMPACVPHACQCMPYPKPSAFDIAGCESCGRRIEMQGTSILHRPEPCHDSPFLHTMVATPSYQASFAVIDCAVS